MVVIKLYTHLLLRNFMPISSSAVAENVAMTYEVNVYYCRKMFIGGLSWQTTSGNMQVCIIQSLESIAFMYRPWKEYCNGNVDSFGIV